MQYKEYGNRGLPVIVLLHGGGLSWWNYREAAKLLENDYHVVLPILDGHAGSDCSFSTIESNAAEVIDFIDAEFGGRVLILGGLSLGAQTVLEILSTRSDICSHAVIESALVQPSRVTQVLIGPALDCSYGLIKRKWFAKLQFKQLRIKPELFDDYYRDTCAITKWNMKAFMLANSAYELKKTICGCGADVNIFAGTCETGSIIRSAEILHESIKGAKLYRLQGLYHGDFSINHAGEFARRLSEIAGLQHT